MTYKSIHETLKKAFILYIPLSFLTPLLMYQWRDNNRLIVMDQAHSYHVTEYTAEESLRRLYKYQVKQAVFAFLMRNPAGFDSKELVDAMFVETARNEVQKQFASEAEQFRIYKMHQKPEELNPFEWTLVSHHALLPPQIFCAGQRTAYPLLCKQFRITKNIHGGV